MMSRLGGRLLPNDRGDPKPSCDGELGADCRINEVRVRDILDSSRTNSFAVARRSSILRLKAAPAMRRTPMVTVAM
jgi:hypothetical protein